MYSIMTDNQPNKTFAFIDASNLIYGASQYGWKIDCQKLHIQNTASIKLISFPKQTAKKLKQLLGSNFSNLDNWKTILKMEKK